MFTPEAVFWQFAGNLAQPVFDGFRLERSVGAGQGAGKSNCSRPIVRPSFLAFGDVELAFGRRSRTGPSARRLQRTTWSASSRRACFEIAETETARGHRRPCDRAADAADPVRGRETRSPSVRQGAALQCAVLSLYQALGGSWLPPPAEDIAITTQRQRDGQPSPLVSLETWWPASPPGWYWTPAPVVQKQKSQGRLPPEGGTANSTDPRARLLAIDARLADEAGLIPDGRRHTRGRSTPSRCARRSAGKIAHGSLHGRPGRQARRSCSPRSIRRTYQAQYDQADRQEGAGRGARSPMRSIDLERYTRLAAANSGIEAAGRYARVRWSLSSRRRCRFDQAAIDNAHRRC